MLALQKLMPENVLSEDFLSGVKSIDYKSVITSSPVNIIVLCQFLPYTALQSVVRRSQTVSLILINSLVLDVQGTTKINIAVDRLPMFRACGRTGSIAGPEHYGTIHLGADW